MVKMNVVYKGQKHCELTHVPSGSKIESDAPKDNHGKGECFSPTDLVGAALASCILTTIAIIGEREGLALDYAKVDVEKIMADGPRRIGALILQVTLPAKLGEKERARCEEIAKNCPVYLSLHPNTNIRMTFFYC